MNRRRSNQLTRIVEAFQKFEPEQHRLVMEVVRRQAPDALEAVTGHREIPANWNF